MRPDNHIVLMWGSKGGAGTSVTAAAAALHETKPVLLVDLDGDAASILGADRSRSAIGANDWLAHNDVEGARLTELVDHIDDTTSVLPSGVSGDVRHANPQRLEQLAKWIADQPGIVIIDAGTGPPPQALVDIADRNVMVTRADYLALSNPGVLASNPDEIVLVKEPGRALNQRDIERAMNAPVNTVIELDPVIARSVDAGMFLGHRGLERATSKITNADITPDRLPEPEIDYGMRWTSNTTDGSFRVSYNPGTHQLTATNNVTHSTEILGRYDDIASVDRALEGWVDKHNDAGGLDWLEEQVGVDAPDFAGPRTTPVAARLAPPPPTHDLGISLA
ncbi:MAG: hypothetical protein ACE37B_11385 [Ilumatobacter sp.]|uniref:hypothetical protein n=1 Tax=Ilumatobacter sp. TaxID=1967498 RepID=UPI0039196DF6